MAQNSVGPCNLDSSMSLLNVFQRRTLSTWFMLSSDSKTTMTWKDLTKNDKLH